MSERQAESYQDNTGSAGQRTGSDSGVSAMLRASRMRIGEDLRDVANVLRIRHRYLEDIEEGRFDDLPGNTYAIGFIRSYADHLGLDGEEVVRRFKEEAAALKSETSLEFPAPISESGIPAGALMFVGAVIAVLAYGVWYISTSEKNYIAELISPLPDRLAKMLPEEESKTAVPDSPASSSAGISGAQPGVSEGAGKPAEEKAGTAPDSAAATDATPGAADPSAESSRASNETTAPESAPPEAAPSKTAPSATAPGEPLQGESAAPSSSAVTEPARNEAAEESASADAPASKTENAAVQEKAAPAPETAPEKAVAPRATAGRIYGAENEGARIVVRAKMNSWIQVRDDVANQLLLTRLLRQGDSYRVPNRDGLKLLAGNAGALEILVDGKTVPPIGPQGAVRRSVMLDATKLQQGKAVVE